MGSHFGCYRYFILTITCHCFSVFSFAADRITAGESIREGDTIISAGQKYALGFFSLEDSGSRYVGIWYHKDATKSPVWVASRDRPIQATGGVLTIGDDGNLIVRDGNGETVWSSNGTAASGNSTAVLKDTGNLVLHAAENPDRVLWQSFDHPGDTFLPDMKVHFSTRDGERRVFTSWRSSVDPSPGNYTMGVADTHGPPQIVIWEGLNRRWRSGYWDGKVFTGVPGIRARYYNGFTLSNEPDGRLYFMYAPTNRSDIVKFRITWEGAEMQEMWIDDNNKWNVTQSRPVDECDKYNRCGPFGKCNEMAKPRCSCVEGFVPKDRDQWSREDWSSGCTKKASLQCEEGRTTDDFLKVRNVKLPDYADFAASLNITDCKKRCLQNCLCAAYAINEIGCMIWSKELVDIQQFEEGGSSLFVRVAGSELSKKNRATQTIAIAAAVVGTLVVIISIWLCLWRKRCEEILSRNKTLRVGPSGEISREFLGPYDQLGVEGQQATGTELAMFSFNYVATATDNFSDENKLGEGGFGQVYKGTLPGEQVLAVKRLATKSGQGLEEFKNEITLIAKLQHRNLVRLLGCSIAGDERMLLYEYMPNKSLDSYLFDSDKKAQLAWSQRFTIIEGIARGLLYLHRDSRLRIIHRDLKASNILLDQDMNPKISDFGMARIFGGSQNEANSTKRVVGTFGYMAPEYAMEGLFSLKSDVYSFGVLLLELITGQRNAGFRSTEYSNIIGYTWDLWKRGKAVDLLDPSISESCSEEQVARCVQIGLLCVQDVAGHRPDMQAVVLMLESENAALPLPIEPTFASMRHNLDEEIWNGYLDALSSNNVTISVILGR